MGQGHKRHTKVNALFQAELCLKLLSGIDLDLSNTLMNVCVRFKAKLKKHL